jgi:peroxiredoxin
LAQSVTRRAALKNYSHAQCCSGVCNKPYKGLVLQTVPLNEPGGRKRGDQSGRKNRSAHELMVDRGTGTRVGAILAGFWLGWQLLRQNGRLLLRVEELEQRMDELESGESDDEPRNGRPEAALSEASEFQNPKSELDQSLVTSAATADGEERENRFRNRSLARSKIKRDGLKAGTPAPDFRLPRLDGRGDLTLSELRGKRVLLVLSSPGCGPCNALAPELESFHRQHPELEVLMISKGEPKENRAKLKEHGLTFPVVLQQHWEISRRYAMFATPIAYLLDEAGVIMRNVAVGTDAIRGLLATHDEPDDRMNRIDLATTTRVSA